MAARIFGLRFSVYFAFLMIGTGMQLPFLPLWLHAKGLSVAEVAIVIAGMTASRIVAVPIAAAVADTYRNRRSLIIYCGFAALLGYLLLAFASGFWPILVAGLFVSLCFAPVFPLAESFSIDGSMAYGLDYGRLRLWASVSFLVGSLAAGALLLSLPMDALIYLIAAAQGVSAVMALLLPADPVRHTPGKNDGSPANPFAAFGLLMAGSFVLFIAAVSLGQASHAMLYAFGPVLWDSQGYGKFTIGSFWAISIVAEVALFSVSNIVVNRFGPMTLIIAGISGGVLRWLVMAEDFGLAVTVLMQAIHCVSFAMLHLGTMHYIYRTVPAGFRNSAQGIYAAFSGGIVMSSAMWFSGFLYSELLGKTYLVMAVISLVALSLALALKRFHHDARSQ